MRVLTPVALALIPLIAACAVAPVPTDTPAPTSTPVPWWKTWEAVNDADLGTRGVGAFATAVRGRADTAILVIVCYTDHRSTEVRTAFEVTGGEEAARKAKDSIDQVHISRRSMGEPGRWMKSGWEHSTANAYLVLKEAPAASFIGQLAEVEEFAVLVTHDYGEDTAAVFDVRYLNAALASDDVGWDC